ncbi:hypothetical protein [Paenibacillus sp. HGF5]|uniref:hypothetical protein n=1 Tax=Paenibacillus sp. HGF5 TaxID=908341 RepID=UPI0002072D6D|nr:hypothetical protein [Paenibacillus sp. HGF5]EGG35253.1 hypothetical protein HMPREF9412_3219 [Paenibacillus sp. HGF5]
MGSETEDQLPMNLDSCNVILDTAKTIYNEEYDRFKQIETKTGVAIGFVGVLFGFFLTYLNSVKITSNDVGYLIYTFGLRFIIIVLLTISALKFMNAIKVGEFVQVKLDRIVDKNTARMPPEEVTLSVAATYQEVIQSNEKKIDRKTDKYKDGLKFMVYGFLLFLVYFCLEEVIRYV